MGGGENKGREEGRRRVGIVVMERTETGERIEVIGKRDGVLTLAKMRSK